MYPLSQRSLNHETCTQIKIQGCRKIPSLKNMEGRVYDLVNNHLGVSKNRGTPKWMVKIMENPMNKWKIWGGHLYFWKHPFINFLGHHTVDVSEIG